MVNIRSKNSTHISIVLNATYSLSICDCVVSVNMDTKSAQPLEPPVWSSLVNKAEGVTYFTAAPLTTLCPFTSALSKKQLPLLHLFPRCQSERDHGAIYGAPHFLFVKRRPLSACPKSNLHCLISLPLLLFKCCLEKWREGWMGYVALHVHHR